MGHARRVCDGRHPAGSTHLEPLLRHLRPIRRPAAPPALERRADGAALDAALAACATLLPGLLALASLPDRAAQRQALLQLPAALQAVALALSRLEAASVVAVPPDAGRRRAHRPGRRACSWISPARPCASQYPDTPLTVHRRRRRPPPPRQRRLVARHGRRRAAIRRGRLARAVAPAGRARARGGRPLRRRAGRAGVDDARAAGGRAPARRHRGATPGRRWAPGCSVTASVGRGGARVRASRWTTRSAVPTGGAAGMQARRPQPGAIARA